jgi:DNA-binding LacI/PurR family transcriptional regulator
LVTLADIAKHAEVSSGTVSRVLNNKTGIPISQPTIDRIRRAAAELGYRPNALARALATGKTQAIGLCYHSITEPMFIRILEAAEATVRERGYHLIVSSDPESFSAESTIDGLVYIGVPDDTRAQAIARHKPVMFVGPAERSDPAARRPNTVTWSEYDAAFLAVRHLAGLGHRTIGALWGDFKETATLHPRVAGFRDGLEAFGLTGAEEFDERDPGLSVRGFRQMQRLLARSPRPTAVFARNDYLALGALKQLHAARIAVPRNMSVIYYGNSVLATAAYVELTSVSHPNAEASAVALDQLITMIDSGVTEFPNVSLPITLREHDSCAPPAPDRPSRPASVRRTRNVPA